MAERGGRGHIKINRAGSLDAERTAGRVAGTFHIAVLGASMVEVLKIPVEQWSTELIGER
jgi:hypothetical protein